MSFNDPKERRAFGVEYVPPSKRLRPKKGEPVFVGLVSEIPPGTAKAVVLENYKAAVFNVNGKFYAIKDACPHAEYPLAKGTLRGEVVFCSSHNWQFNVTTGQCLKGDPEIKIRTFEVDVRGDEVWLKP
jgi:nitrite reductase/ring-hydroxylating ferredoxin subunit